MDISQISVQRSTPGESAEGIFYNFEIYMALSEYDVLSSTFVDNWIPGTRHLVFQRDSVTISNSAGDWEDFLLDSSFWYNGEENLIVELLWSSADTDDSCMYAWHWNSGNIRSITGQYSNPTGTMSSLVIMFKFQGDMAQQAATFGQIKTLMGS